jgi:predicted  nucleic acid-binding Zn-ribbon protein
MEKKMTTRKEYIDDLSVKLKSWDTEISKLELRLKESSNEAKENLSKRIAELEVKKENLQNRIEVLKSSSEDAWSEIKSGMEKIESEIQETLENVKSKF